MMLVQSSWNKQQTFRMVPINKDCPYVECICDPDTKVFVIISTITKNSFHMVPKLDDYGKPITGNKGPKQEKRQATTFQEYYLEDVDSIISIVKHFAQNEKTFKFKWKEFLKDKEEKKPSAIITEPKPEIITS